MLTYTIITLKFESLYFFLPRVEQTIKFYHSMMPPSLRKSHSRTGLLSYKTTPIIVSVNGRNSSVTIELLG